MIMIGVMLLFFAFGLVCAFIWNVVYPRFLDRLRSKHSPVWEELNRPKYIEFRSKPMTGVMRFLWHREYATLDDKGLTSLGVWARTALIGVYLGAGVFVVCFVILYLLGEIR
jgi:hypothetical protein